MIIIDHNMGTYRHVQQTSSALLGFTELLWSENKYRYFEPYFVKLARIQKKPELGQLFVEYSTIIFAPFISWINAPFFFNLQS